MLPPIHIYQFIDLVNLTIDMREVIHSIGLKKLESRKAEHIKDILYHATEIQMIEYNF